MSESLGGGQERVAPTWETPQLVQPTMVEAHFSLFVNMEICFMRNMIGLHVGTLSMDGRGFCNGSLAGDNSGATAGSTTAGATIKP